MPFFNPLTYAAKGLRYAMVPAVAIHGHTFEVQTLDMRWVPLALAVSTLAVFSLGTRTFRRRVVS